MSFKMAIQHKKRNRKECEGNKLPKRRRMIVRIQGATTGA